MSRASYKKYQIETLQSEGTWTARIITPRTDSELKGPITATASEGEMVLLGRAYEAVDEDLSRKK